MDTVLSTFIRTDLLLKMQIIENNSLPSGTKYFSAELKWLFFYIISMHEIRGSRNSKQYFAFAPRGTDEHSWNLSTRISFHLCFVLEQTRQKPQPPLVSTQVISQTVLLHTSQEELRISSSASGCLQEELKSEGCCQLGPQHRQRCPEPDPLPGLLGSSWASQA